MIYQFNGFKLHTANFRLSKDGQEIAVEPQVIDLIVYLLEHRDRLVSRDELFEKLWSGKNVVDASLSNHIKVARSILDDNGKDQLVIKTIRGRGYQFVAEAELLSLDHGLEVKNALNGHFPKPKSSFGLKVSLSVAFIFLSYLLFQYVQHMRLVAAVQRIAHYQDISYTTFVAQAKRRNELVELIKQRLKVKRDTQYEKFFSMYFEQLNNEELFIFEQIRGMTSVGLYENNQKIVAELKQNPQILVQIKGAVALQRHLIFWINKYHSVFESRKDMCLLYVGVEDGVPYPDGVNQEIKQWLSE